MSDNGILTLVRLAAAVGVFGYASVIDLRTRRAPNSLWILLAVAGAVLIPVQLAVDDRPLKFALVLVPIGAILADVYIDSGESKHGALIAASKYAIAVVSIAILALAFADDGFGYVQHYLAIPVLMLVFVAMYFFDVIRGGADAKALISLAILFPFYPSFGVVSSVNWEATIDVLFPFALVVLMTAAVVVAITPLGFVVVNLMRGEYRFPQAFFGFKASPEQLKGKHYWLMERMEGERHVIYTKPKAEEDLDSELQKLVEAGHKRLWVTPKIPFILPMLFVIIVTAIFGNVFFLVASL